jgi:predicted branched-subunit amino acid permease
LALPQEHTQLSFGAIAQAAGFSVAQVRALSLARLAPLLRQRGLGWLRAAHLVIDESTAMATVRDDPRAAQLGFWATGLAVFVCWNLGTVAGAAGASVLADPRSLGLDAAAPAAFLALVAPRIRRRETAIVAGLAALAAIISTPVAAVGVPVLLAALVAVAGKSRGGARAD